MNKVLIVGGGHLAKQIDHFVSNYDPNHIVIGFVDDYLAVGSMNFGRTCVGAIRDIDELYNKGLFDLLVIGIGYNHLQKRKELFEKYETLIPFYSFIHPTAFVDVTATLGKGVVVGPKVVLEQGVKIGNNVFLYNSVNISHDSIVKPHSFLAPSVTIAGFSVVGSCCFLGVGSVVIDNICINENISLGAGTLVIRDLIEPGVYVGNPCRKLQ
jgi:sugar O-acyltransferase (sialic acid O-acetyltransferase NeuD family)